MPWHYSTYIPYRTVPTYIVFEDQEGCKTDDMSLAPVAGFELQREREEERIAERENQGREGKKKSPRPRQPVESTGGVTDRQTDRQANHGPSENPIRGTDLIRGTF